MSDKDLIADARAAMDYSDDTGWFWVGRLADALEAATRERDAVPDAATEERIDRWMLLVGKCVEERMDAEAERDAALASLERVRAIAERTSVNPLIRITEILAALDGAPEPEWEYRVMLKNGAEVARGTLDEVRRFKTIDIERRRKAGPWETVEGEE